MTDLRDDALGQDGEHLLALADLADLSGLSEAEVLDLVDYGALAPADTAAGECFFSVRSIVVARTAHRLRDEFDIEPHGVALLLSFPLFWWWGRRRG